MDALLPFFMFHNSCYMLFWLLTNKLTNPCSVWFLYSTTKHKKKVQIAHFLVSAHGQIYNTPSSVILMTGGCNNSLPLAVEN